MTADKKGKPRKKKEPLAPGEKRRLRQLAACLVLFVIVFVGRGVDLTPITQLSGQVAQLVRADTDFQAVFAQVGQTIQQGEDWVKTFLPSEEEQEPAGEDAQTP